MWYGKTNKIIWSISDFAVTNTLEIRPVWQVFDEKKTDCLVVANRSGSLTSLENRHH